MRISRATPLLLVSLWACGGQQSRPPNTGLAEELSPQASPTTGSAKKKDKDDPLFPANKTGWSEMGADETKQAAAFAADYLAFVSNRTERQSASAVLALAKEAGAKPFDQRPSHKPGELLYWQDAAHSSVALLKIGNAPIEEGVQIIIASLDAAVIRLTPNPVYDKSGLALFDTGILGDLKLESWLNTPLMLAIHIAPSASGGKAREITIGDDADEPVFAIPDLLPHLSRKVQRDKLVDSPERLDALAGFSSKAVASLLKRYGLGKNDWNRAEAELLAAGPASYVGVDRALIAAANHHARALPFAATRALLESQPRRSSLVILMGHSSRSYAGAGPEAHVENLLPAAIAMHQSKVDALTLRRIHAQSAVLLFDNKSGDRNKGVVLNTRKDDSTPESLRHVLQVFSEGKAHTQIVEEGGWSEAREIASLDIDALEMGLPIKGYGTPYQLLSTYDLYQALRACQAWMGQ